MDCRFCAPDKTNKSYWEEDGFYGYQCFECTKGNTAIIALVEHKEIITENEKKILNKLMQKYYPDMSPIGGPNRHMIFHHFYELMSKKKNVVII